LRTEDLDLADKGIVPASHGLGTQGNHVVSDPRAQQVRVRRHHADGPHRNRCTQSLLNFSGHVGLNPLQILTAKKVGLAQQYGCCDAGVTEEREETKIFLGQRRRRVEEKRRVITSRQVRERLQGTA
jgi:hypothetical protein